MADQNTSTWETVKNFMFGKGALDKAASTGMPSSTPPASNNTLELQKAVNESMKTKQAREAAAIGAKSGPVNPAAAKVLAMPKKPKMPSPTPMPSTTPMP